MSLYCTVPVHSRILEAQKKFIPFLTELVTKESLHPTEPLKTELVLLQLFTFVHGEEGQKKPRPLSFIKGQKISSNLIVPIPEPFVLNSDEEGSSLTQLDILTNACFLHTYPEDDPDSNCETCVNRVYAQITIANKFKEDESLKSLSELILSCAMKAITTFKLPVEEEMAASFRSIKNDFKRRKIESPSCSTPTGTGRGTPVSRSSTPLDWKTGLTKFFGEN